MNIEQQMSKELQGYDWLEKEQYIDNETGVSSMLVKNVDWVLSLPNSEEEFFQLYSYEVSELILEDANLIDVVEFVKENAQNFDWIK